ncbi:aminoacyl-histidine dipeptidase [Caviibacter abscessus]|uniref:aminoacyl-histidine dipeptidase n=1 Tax=Caviibacter abscessus TaxID=1766719 RepID=UPI00082AC929|nr:aminoacyl-histidine dipeptidase [Caviibacter abscessus]
MELEKLYPERVFHYFREISKIPRGSGNEKEISDYLVKFAKDHNLYVYQDEKYNILIRKEATKGYKKYKPIALQGHMDMVCEKNKDVEFDFEKDEIKILVKDGFLVADGTTLGADNGICVAMVLSILESNEIKHPKLEILLTTDEEVGMSGAIFFDVSKLESDILVNVDSEQYGTICVSSAGCARVRTMIDFEMEEIINKDKIYSLELKGLSGGHSGADINENKANANKILNEIIRRLSITKDVNIIDFNGGNKNNTIPRESHAHIVCDENFETVNEIVQMAMDSLSYEYKESESTMQVIVEKIEYTGQKQMTISSTYKFMQYISGYLTGVIRKSKDIENLIQTSLNLGVVELNNGHLMINTLVRSAILKEQNDLCDYVVEYGNKFGGESIIDDTANPWEYKKDSKIRDYFAKVFKEQTGQYPKIEAIHAGLECGIFYESNDKLDIISIGPDIKNPHTPDERMSISAVAQTWEFLLKVLEEYTIV